MRKILVINPGSTSTKISLFVEENEIAKANLVHQPEELKGFNRVAEQAEMRLACIRKFLQEHKTEPSSLAGVVGRGGLLKPIESGVYEVNQRMIDDLSSGIYGEHASNLGAIIAFGLAQEAKCKAYIVDPVVVDEMSDIARLSGMPELPRRSIFHALNQKSSAREVARRIGKPYNECNFIVAHLGGGISVGAHCQGRVVDVNNALDGDGPFSPERSGGVPAGQLAELCFSGKYTHAEIKKMITGRGGVVAYKNTNQMTEIKAAVDNGDIEAKKVYEALIYQVAKEIASHGATLCGKVDRIILTGGIAHDETLVEKISERVSFLAPVDVIPGEREMLSLARGFFAVADKKEEAKEYL